MHYRGNVMAFTPETEALIQKAKDKRAEVSELRIKAGNTANEAAVVKGTADADARALTQATAEHNQLAAAAAAAIAKELSINYNPPPLPSARESASKSKG